MNLKNIRKAVYEKNPLIHAITNPISINLCANTALAVGARPMMAEHPEEVADIIKTAQALLLNLGNITDVRINSMMISSSSAHKLNIPTVIDAVGAACSPLRRKVAFDIIKENQPLVIKGNYSEIRALYDDTYFSPGVDAENIDIEEAERICLKLSKRHSAIVLASGKTDIITDGEKIFKIKNGCTQLSRITGTGCMLGMLCACYLSAQPDIYAVITAAAVMGICGETASTDKGSGSFMTNLLDALSILSDADFEKYLRLEEVTFEKF